MIEWRPENSQMIIVIFRSRMAPEAAQGELLEEYLQDAEEMNRRVQHYPGFRSIKTFEAPDGERVSISEFDTEEQARAWKEDVEHLKVQQRGRTRYYEEYQVQVCELLRSYEFSRESASEGKESAPPSEKV